jgi:hypothetical protein
VTPRSTGGSRPPSTRCPGIAAGLQAAGEDVSVSLGGAAVPVGLTLEAFADLYTWLSAGCDGPVAVDGVSGPRYQFDAWADDTNGDISFNTRYPGTDTPSGRDCNHVNSDYRVRWHVQHFRLWDAVIWDRTQAVQLRSGSGVSAATHNGAVHVFGVMPGPAVTHGRTFTGSDWIVDGVAVNSASDLPVSAVSFDDRLYIFGARADGSIWPQAYTTDGGSWVKTAPQAPQPAGLQTNEPIATAVFGNRLYVFARSVADNSLQATSTSDVQFWTPWAIVPETELAPSTPVAAAALGDRLYIFGVFDYHKENLEPFVVSNATSDGTTWTGWQVVENANARPDGGPLSDEGIPLDVAATTFDDRIYIASRWQRPGPFGIADIAVNFSADGDNWAGWRTPLVMNPASGAINIPQPSATPSVAGVSNHLYIFTAAYDPVDSTSTLVAVY